MSEAETDLHAGDTGGGELITSSRESTVEMILGDFPTEGELLQAEQHSKSTRVESDGSATTLIEVYETTTRREADSGVVQVQSSVVEKVETVRISNADSSNEVVTKEAFVSQAETDVKDELENEHFQVVEIDDMPENSKKSSSEDEKNNDDLLAILEGDPDSTTARAEQPHAIVVEVIEGDDDKEAILESPDAKKIALDQIQDIVQKRGRPFVKKGKQDGGSLISALVSDWSDTEKDADSANESTTPVVTKSPSKDQPSKVASPKKSSPAQQKKPVKKAPAVKPVVPPVAIRKPARTIKKKVIWDPDAPETQVSYASLVKASPVQSKRGASNSGRSTPIQATPKRKVETPAPKETESPAPSKKHTIPHTTAAEKTKVLSQPTQIRAKVQYSAAEKAKTTPLPPKPKALQRQAVVHVRKLATKRPSTSPSAGTAEGKRKRVSEIDRLLKDEGAANMLNALEGEKSAKPEQKQQTKRARKPATPTPTPRPQTPKNAATPRRTPKSAASSWDYVYNQQNVDSLIIRRRSNSSYSSTSPRRLSLDLKTERTGRGGKTSGGFQFAKPETKKAGKRTSDIATESLIAEDIKKTRSPEMMRKSNRTPVPTETKVFVTKTGKLTPVVTSPQEVKNTLEVTVKRHGSVVQLILKPKIEKIRNTFTVQLMNEVVRQLDILESDDGCKVLVITSGPSFCQGVDFWALTQGNAEKRKFAAQELAGSVTSFLKALITFPKPLIAGIMGSCSGIGVTMLPAFDVVIASDKSTFETPYGKIGQIPEGNCLITSTNNVRHTFKTKLLWFSQKLTSTEAALSGLVTELTAPSKVSEDAIQCAKRIAALSQQTFTSIKSQKPDVKRLLTTLNDEQKLLVNHWQTSECQEKFKQYIAKESW